MKIEERKVRGVVDIGVCVSVGLGLVACDAWI